MTAVVRGHDAAGIAEIVEIMPDRRTERLRDYAGHIPVCHSLLDGGRILASRGVPGKQVGGSDVDRDVVGVEGRLEQEVGRSRGDVPVRERHISAARYRAERVFEVPEVDPVPRIVEILVVQAVRVGESVEAGQGEIARLVVGMAPHQVAEGARQRRDLVRGKITETALAPTYRATAERRPSAPMTRSALASRRAPPAGW